MEKSKYRVQYNEDKETEISIEKFFDSLEEARQFTETIKDKRNIFICENIQSWSLTHSEKYYWKVIGYRNLNCLRDLLPL
jgi:hypothetical protein